MKREIEEQGGRVLLSTSVTKINLSSEDVSVCANGKEFRGRWVVVAIPPSCWDGIEFPFKTDPYRIAMGPAFNFLADTQKRFWMRDSLSPNGTDDRFGMVWEGTDTEDGLRGDPELTVFAGGPAAETAQKSSDPDQYFRQGLENLYKGFRNEVEKTTSVNWSEEEWTRLATAVLQLVRLRARPSVCTNRLGDSSGPASTPAWLSSATWKPHFNQECMPHNSSQRAKKSRKFEEFVRRGC
jgi:monoamine oxidase